jgi:hypothetical protein
MKGIIKDTTQELLTAVFEDETIKPNEVYLAEIDLLESYLLQELTEFFTKGVDK